MRPARWMRVRRRVSISRKHHSGGAFCRRATGARVESDLEFTSEVVSKNTGEHVQLVSHPRLDRYVVHLAMRLEFGKDTLLRATSFVEEDDLAWL